MAKKNNGLSFAILFRLDDTDLKKLDICVALEQKAHPGRRITRAGIAKEIVVAFLQGKELDLREKR